MLHSTPPSTVLTQRENLARFFGVLQEHYSVENRIIGRCMFSTGSCSWDVYYLTVDRQRAEATQGGPPKRRKGRGSKVHRYSSEIHSEDMDMVLRSAVWYKSCTVFFDRDPKATGDPFLWEEMHRSVDEMSTETKASSIGGREESRPVFDNDENAFPNVSANVTDVDRIWATGAGTIAYVKGTGVSELWELYGLRLSAAVYRQPVATQLLYTSDRYGPRSTTRVQEEDEAALFRDDYPLIGKAFADGHAPGSGGYCRVYYLHQDVDPAKKAHKLRWMKETHRTSDPKTSIRPCDVWEFTRRALHTQVRSYRHSTKAGAGRIYFCFLSKLDTATNYAGCLLQSLQAEDRTQSGARESTDLADYISELLPPPLRRSMYPLNLFQPPGGPVMVIMEQILTAADRSDDDNGEDNRESDTDDY